MTRRLFLAAASLALIALMAAPLSADTFGSDPNNTFKIEFVTIGNPGNPADTVQPSLGQVGPSAPYPGSVDYVYRMGKYEVSRAMIDKANAAGGLGITLQDMTIYGGDDPDKPATGISWYEAARFVSWLNTSTGHAPAYKFNEAGMFQLWGPGDAGYDPNNLYRNRLAKYFLPSFDEWHKSAYYDPNSGDYFLYPTGSDTAPTAVAGGTVTNTAVYGQEIETGPAAIDNAGALSPYGTLAQGGNVSEWEETSFDHENISASIARGLRGGDWFRSAYDLVSSYRADESPLTKGFGVRVASSIPEPSSMIIFTIGFFAMFNLERIKQA